MRFFFRLVELYRFRALLGALLAIIAQKALAPETPLLEGLGAVLTAMVFIGALWGTRDSAGVRVCVVGSAVSLLWLALMLLRLAGTDGPGGIAILVTLVVVVLVAWSTFAALFFEARADADALAGAIFGFFLLALLWAGLYDAIELRQPGSFALSQSGSASEQLLYFSLVTITALGYGDILPVSAAARALAGLEAATGTLYLAILIGSIVSALKPRAKRPTEGDGRPEGSRD